MARQETHLDYATPPAKPPGSWIEQVDQFHLAFVVIRRIAFAIGCAALGWGICRSMSNGFNDGPNFAALGAGIMGLTIRVPWARWRMNRDDQEG
jgi:hypothetical protein